jgi:regulatory protein
MDADPPQPTITAIQNGSRGQRIVVLSDGRAFPLSNEANERVRPAEGDVATPEMLEALDAAELRVRAHDAALRLLGHRARSEQELRTRLAMRGMPLPVVNDEIERLRAVGLLDDEKFAKSWVEDRKRTAPRGRRLLRYELAGRGVAAESIEHATEGLDDRETALALARGKARGAALADYATFVARIGAFLQRRGFEYEVAAEAVRVAWAEAVADRPAPDDDPAASSK